MLDIKLIEQQRDTIAEKLNTRGFTDMTAVDRAIALNKKRRELVSESEQLRAEQKERSKKMPAVMRNGTDEEKAAMRESLRAMSEKVKSFDPALKNIENEIRDILLTIPNIPHDSTPVGKSEEENVEVSTRGTRPDFSFPPRQHFDIVEEQLGLDTAAVLSGARFSCYHGSIARLARALTNFMLDMHRTAGYCEITPPVLVSRESMTRTGQLPKFEDDAFRTSDDMFLIPTAEVPLVNLHTGQKLDHTDLPRRYVAFTPCFRREAGSYGKDTRGIIRLHQFNKVELVQFTEPEQSERALKELLDHAASVLRSLGLHYRIVSLCTGDMGFAAQRTYDIEVWLPGQNTYREISSCSNTGDFQARRANIRYRTNEGELRFLHTLNGSGLAVDRTMVAIIENYQNSDGSVTIPHGLRPYMDNKTVIFPE